MSSRAAKDVKVLNKRRTNRPKHSKSATTSKLNTARDHQSPDLKLLRVELRIKVNDT